MTIDLSFTKDPEWIKNREEAWKPIGKSLAQDLDAKTVNRVKHYFITGEFLEGERISDGACFAWFPLQTNEGWDHVFENIVLGEEVFGEKFYSSLRSQEGYPITAEEELALWDYFHPKMYQSIIKSRVPVGKEKKYVELKVDPHKVGSNISVGILNYLGLSDFGCWPKWCQRADYFFSLLPHLFYDKSKKYKKRDQVQLCYDKIGLLFKYILDQNYWASGDGHEEHRNRFSETFKEKLDSMGNLPEKMQELWNEAKAKYQVN